MVQILIHASNLSNIQCPSLEEYYWQSQPLFKCRLLVNLPTYTQSCQSTFLARCILTGQLKLQNLKIVFDMFFDDISRKCCPFGGSKANWLALLKSAQLSLNMSQVFNSSEAWPKCLVLTSICNIDLTLDCTMLKPFLQYTYRGSIKCLIE